RVGRTRAGADRARHRARVLRGRVAGRVHARYAGPAVGVGDDRPALAEAAAERRRQAVRLTAPGAHEEGVARLVRAARELDALELAPAARQPPHRLLAHAHAGAEEGLPLAVETGGPVRAEHDVLAPSRHDKR